jgi:hypothetical protein
VHIQAERRNALELREQLLHARHRSYIIADDYGRIVCECFYGFVTAQAIRNSPQQDICRQREK